MKIDVPVMKGIDDTAAAFNITSHHARQLALQGLVKAVRVGRGKILINQQSVCDYFNNTTLTNNNDDTQSGIRPIPSKL